MAKVKRSTIHDSESKMQTASHLSLTSEKDITSATPPQHPSIIATNLLAAATEDTINSGHIQDSQGVIVGTSSALVVSSESWDFETGRTLKIFHLFPKLPAELRIKIWHEALAALGSRLIEMLWSECRGMCTDCPIPTYLHVSSESRIEASKVYKKFRTTYDPITIKTGEVQEPYVYINYDRDMLLLGFRDAADRGFHPAFEKEISAELLGPGIPSPLRIEDYIVQVLLRSGREHLQHIALSANRIALTIYTDAVGKFSNLKTCAATVDDNDWTRPTVGYTNWDPYSLVQPSWLSRIIFPAHIAIRQCSEDEKLRLFYGGHVSFVKKKLTDSGMDKALIDKIYFDTVQIHRQVAGS